MRLFQLPLAGGLNPRMGGKLLCNRTTGSKPRFLRYHRQTWGEGAGGGGRGPQDRASRQPQVSPKSCLSNPRQWLAWGPPAQGTRPPARYFSHFFCSEMSGAHTQVLIAQTVQASLEEPSYSLLPESDLGAPVSPQGPSLKPVPHICLVHLITR